MKQSLMDGNALKKIKAKNSDQRMELKAKRAAMQTNKVKYDNCKVLNI